MSPDPANRNPQSDELEAAIDALLEEIDTTCTRYENPVTPGDETPAPDRDEPETATDAEPEEASTETPSPADDAESAIDKAAASADELLEQAADDLRRSGRIVGELLFTADASAGEISVAAELAPVAEG